MAGSNLMSCYVDPVREILEKGNGGKIVIGTKDYKIIQGNRKIKGKFEATIRDYPEFFIRFHPELSKDNQKTSMSQDRKSGKKNAGAINLFESGVPLSDFDTPLNDLTKMFYEKYGTN